MAQEVESIKCWREGCDPVLEPERVRCTLCGLNGPTGWEEMSSVEGWNYEMERRNHAFFVGPLKDGYWVRGAARGETYEEVTKNNAGDAT